MNLLTINNFSKAITDRNLFVDTSFSLSEGDKVGVIGVNGTGKTTLLKIIAGITETDSGEVVKNNNLKINYLSQNPEFQKGMTIYNYVILQNSKSHEHWDIEGEAKTILNVLGFSDYNQVIDNLSGGQRKRVALAAVLLTDSDVLILDEPTNHLDNIMTEWLENYLKKLRKSLIMVTHDRYFLDRICNRIIEIEDTKIYNYSGNYEKYLEEKDLRESIAQASERKRQSILRIELEWMQRGARARSTKQKAHIERFETLRDMEGPKIAEKMQMNSVSSRLGNKTIILNNISKAYDGKCLIKDFDYSFLHTDRIGIVGPNGCGKSTLIKIITGKLLPDSGTVEVGETVKVGYFSQENEYLPENEKVIDYIKATGEYIKTTDGTITASQMLKRFLFDDTLAYQYINRLSGGEKRRLYLLKILMEAPNILILDEPTNDLDINTMRILEDYLETFAGVVISVSHDRYFLNRVVSRIFAYEENGKITQYEGNYDDYLCKRSNNSENNISVNGLREEKVKVEKTKSDKPKMSYNEKREFEIIDDEILKIEEKIEACEENIGKFSSDFIKLNEYIKMKEEAEKELEYKMDRWVYLNELNDMINKN